MEEKKAEYKDFEFIKTLGKGAYGEVLLAKKKDTQKQFAIKAISKQLLEKERKQYQVLIEKELLSRLNHVGVVKLYYSFQDQNNLFIAIELCNSGDFADYLQGNFKFLNIETVQFYTAEMVLIIEYLHQNGIAHRDLKPENLLITENRHLKVIDFGTALFFNNNLVPKALMEKIQQIREQHQKQIDMDMQEEQSNTRERQGTFVGSPQYVSPELLETNICGPEGDLWALGCIIYKMFANDTPFNQSNQYLIYQKVKEGKYNIPEHMPEEAVDLIKKLLVLNPKGRLGAGEAGSGNDFNALKKHNFFKGINWDTIFQSEAPKRHVALNSGGMGPADMDMFGAGGGGDSSDDDLSSPTKGQSIGSGGTVLEGIVLKKVGWMYYKKRKMILLRNPLRLQYFEPDSGNRLGEIILSQNNTIEMSDKSSFTIDGVTKNQKVKKYFFKESSTPATLWVEKIRKELQQI